MSLRNSNKNVGEFRRFCATSKSLAGFLKKNAVVFVLIAVFWVTASALTRTACLSRVFTGLPCPACGVTRAVDALFHGRVADSFSMYPPLLPTAAVLTFSLFAALFKSERLTKVARKLQVATIAMILLVYIVRMVLYFPHTEPMRVSENGIIPRIVRLLTIYIPKMTINS